MQASIHVYHTRLMRAHIMVEKKDHEWLEATRRWAGYACCSLTEQALPHCRCSEL